MNIKFSERDPSESGSLTDVTKAEVPSEKSFDGRVDSPVFPNMAENKSHDQGGEEIKKKNLARRIVDRVKKVFPSSGSEG